MIKFLINSLAIAVVVIIQVSFLSTWPAPISNLNLILCLIIFITALIDYQLGLAWAMAGGFLLELYSGSIFGAVTIGLMAAVILMNFLFSNFFTNRSLYSLLILGLSGTAAYGLIRLLFDFAALIFGFNANFIGFNFWSQFFWQPVFNLIILAVIFFTYYSSTSRLKNIFIFSSDRYEAKSQR